MDLAPLRPARPLEAGRRLAASYAVSLLAAGLAVLAGRPLARTVVASTCGPDPSIPCDVGIHLAWVGGLWLGLAGIAAWWLRLGWAWLGAVVALGLLLLELVGDPTSPAVFLGLLVPGVAALLTDPSLPRARARLAAVLALLVGTVGWFAYVLWDVRTHP